MPTFTELINKLEFASEFHFPYEDYKIIGDINEIERIYLADGYINIDVSDVLSTLSKESGNYVSTGSGEGPEFIGYALGNAISNLPILVGNISKILFNLWVPRKVSTSDIDSMSSILRALSTEIDVSWGITIDDTLPPFHARVSLIAANK